MREVICNRFIALETHKTVYKDQLTLTSLSVSLPFLSPSPSSFLSFSPHPSLPYLTFVSSLL